MVVRMSQADACAIYGGLSHKRRRLRELAEEIICLTQTILQMVLLVEEANFDFRN